MTPNEREIPKPIFFAHAPLRKPQSPAPRLATFDPIVLAFWGSSDPPGILLRNPSNFQVIENKKGSSGRTRTYKRQGHIS
jgi:hypothetical protein